MGGGHDDDGHHGADDVVPDLGDGWDIDAGRGGEVTFPRSFPSPIQKSASAPRSVVSSELVPRKRKFPRSRACGVQ